MKRILTATILLLTMAAYAQATPLRLDYSVAQAAGVYHYEFQLILDNHDSTWVAGQSFNWIVFGAKVNSSPIHGEFTLFTWDLTDFPIGPFTAPNTSSGGLAGPNLFQSGSGWTPIAIGDSLTWSGDAPVELHQGQLHWSNLQGTGCRTGSNLATAHEIGQTADLSGGICVQSQVPEATPIAMILIGLGVGLAKWKRLTAS